MYVAVVNSFPTDFRQQNEDLENGWNIVKLSGGDMNMLSALSHARFLIGSYASPYYRVATALNTAHYIGMFALSNRRHWGVDIEWFEDQHVAYL